VVLNLCDMVHGLKQQYYEALEGKEAPAEKAEVRS